MLTYTSTPNSTIKCPHALFAASKSYNQIKRKRRNDSKEKSDIAKLAKTELLGLSRRERVPQITRQTEMLPSKFAMNVGLRTAVCKAVETALGWDAVKLGPKLLEALFEPSILPKTSSTRSISYLTGAVLGTVRLSLAIDYEAAGFYAQNFNDSCSFPHFCHCRGLSRH